MLASVMLLKPALLIADEPTTALDAVVQRDVLELMVELTQENGTAVLLISHDLGMVARYSQPCIVVMCQGDVVEQGSDPGHCWRGRSTPIRASCSPPCRTRGQRARLPQARRRSSRCAISWSTMAAARASSARSKPKRALHGVSLDVLPGEVVAVVGGSGSGKTTLGHVIAGLIKPIGGEILFDGKPIDRSETAYWDYRLNCQMVFQDPYSSLDPRMTIGDLVGEPLRLVPGMTRGAKEGARRRGPGRGRPRRRLRRALSARALRRPAPARRDRPRHRAPAELRHRRRAGLGARRDGARAGAGALRRAAGKHGFSCLFISHDLGVVEQVADRVVVMNEGRIVEEGDARRDLRPSAASLYAPPALGRSGA